MITRVPRWYWSIAWLLALAAGNINAVGIMGGKHQSLTHLTGTSTQFAVAASQANWKVALHFGIAIGSFVLGSMLSGIIIQDVAFKIGRRYSIALFVVSILLLVSIPFLHAENVFGIYLATCACGLQNAMVTTFSSATIRTTHLSGMFTDLGIYLGHTLRGLPVDKLRLKLCFTIISGFLFGGVLGAAAYSLWGYKAILISALISLVIAIFHWRHQDVVVQLPGLPSAEH